MRRRRRARRNEIRIHSGVPEGEYKVGEILQVAESLKVDTIKVTADGDNVNITITRTWPKE